ncbi:lysosomal acid glucosylceramidase-like [Epargyreus clarus]|uniref:lysosomal acid glucosylceramidase-like n=1 Tax=Epargyreus clarus TaxID=520877 RepID=UPI003C2BC3AE
MKDLIFHILFPISIYFVILCSEITADRPCAARHIPNRSLVCVCNETYCDELTRVIPGKGQYITYTSSAAGLRFQKGKGYFKTCSSNNNGDYLINVNADKKYQKVKGFGGAVTDSAAYLWKSLPKGMQQDLVNSYYGETGLEYNFVRTPIGCSDFSLRHYTYHDEPPKCKGMDSFSLQDEDIKFKIPLIKKIKETSKVEVQVVAATWTPPKWMKYFPETNPGCGFLKPNHYQTFADYLLKFVDSYTKMGVPIWGISTGNEPSLATFPDSPISCMGWATKDQGDWIVNNLGPTIRNSKYKDLQLLALDDQRFTISTVYDMMLKNNSKVAEYINGLAVHYYFDCFVSPDVVTDFTKKNPNAYVISTEASTSSKGVDLGSWAHAKKYIKDMIQDFTHDVVGWMDWNLCLDPNGGPTVDKNFIDSPIIVDSKKKEFLKQPMYYILGHVSKFVPRGSYRIDSSSPPCRCTVSNVAFLTPSNTIVVVIHNPDDARSVTIRQGNREAEIALKPDSVTTVEFSKCW